MSFMSPALRVCGNLSFHILLDLVCSAGVKVSTFGNVSLSFKHHDVQPYLHSMHVPLD